ncbi:type II toxin-antitoxin system VapC family toxin [Candidatus Poriferisocius sp.]|uniref:type II toxin-antitoxin system VapC family toxin n=1 Tax=Candidatus Poriferisocius sp. TaxID=3101276 RepID=UPI003B02C4FE
MQLQRWKPSVPVVDASVLLPVVADGTGAGRRARQRIRGERLDAPDLIRVECLSAIRRQLHHGRLEPHQAELAVGNLLALPIITYPTKSLLSRAWELRDNVTPYDACYVALAEGLGCLLITGDARLAEAPGITCHIELFQ